MFSANTSQVSEDRLYVEDVFSTYLYTGNGSTQTITNGIDLAGKGGMVWSKDRAAGSHRIYDTVRGGNKSLKVDSTEAQDTWSSPYIMTFNSNGYASGLLNNESAHNYASWTFREAPKFFDVVTWTGNGSSGRTISHNLGVAPGCIIVKRTDTTSNWPVYQRAVGATKYLFLNATQAAGTSNAFWNDTEPTSSVFTVGSDATVNANGGTYVAYLFAHDTTSDGIIQCGSYSGVTEVNLGWEPQWLLVKPASSSSEGWFIFDNMRGIPTGGTGDNYLQSQSSAAENTTYPFNLIDLTSTGFKDVGLGYTNTIYIAIRRGPMRTPTSGTSVFSPNTFNNPDGTLVTTGFPIDLQLVSDRGGTAINSDVNTRLLGVSTTSTGLSGYLVTSSTQAFTSDALITKAWNNTSFNISPYWGNTNCISWNFRRAPSFFDVVCYTGTGSATTFNHNLGVAPELMIVKRRDVAAGWIVYAASQTATKWSALNTTNDFVANSTIWNDTAPSSSLFTVGTSGAVNGSGNTYVAYLFASCPGVSKVGSYTGNGSSQTINCGFAAGARFVMIKRTDSTGDWYVWDSARGIVSGNDPRLSLNSTAAEVTTDDSVDTDSSGFVVNQLSATNINVSSATYIYLAVA